MPSDSESVSEHEKPCDEEKSSIREDLSSMTFEEILKLKEELGARVYKEAVLGLEDSEKKTSKSKSDADFKRLNKNRPREMSTRRQVPFMGSELRTESKKLETIRDPRFDEKCGEYNTKTFKENYKFISDVRQEEISQLKKTLEKTENEEERQQIKLTMQKMLNKNVEDRKWHTKQNLLKEEHDGIQKARAEGKEPHFVTKKERRAKELVAQFEDLQKTGRLNKHLEKRRKKNVAKDRKKFSFD